VVSPLESAKAAHLLCVRRWTGYFPQAARETETRRIIAQACYSERTIFFVMKIVPDDSSVPAGKLSHFEPAVLRLVES
jgi:hypothetical protein